VVTCLRCCEFVLYRGQSMNEKTIDSRMIFSGKLLKLEVQDVELESGRKTIREIVRHPGACAVLAELPDGRFVLVRQFRKPVEKDVLEIVAGVLEPGEDPDQCAAREVREETGYKPSQLSKLGTVFPAPGYTDEMLHLYHAGLLSERADDVPDEDEKIEAVCISREDLEEMISNGTIEDAKTLAAWVLYKSRK
jgi:ADP-ribose pyrophosphatase